MLKIRLYINDIVDIDAVFKKKRYEGKEKGFHHDCEELWARAEIKKWVADPDESWVVQKCRKQFAYRK